MIIVNKKKKKQLKDKFLIIVLLLLKIKMNVLGKWIKYLSRIKKRAKL